jgi:hypothetical protein
VKNDKDQSCCQDGSRIVLMATKSYKIVGRQLWQLSVFDEIQRVDCANMSTENKCIF